MKKSFINGIIYTSDKNLPFAEAVIIDGRKISAVGICDDLREEIKSSDEIIDLKGKLMLPGFTDSHLHLMYGAESLTQLDLSKVNSKAKFRAEVIKYLEENKNKNQIIGFGWDENLFLQDGIPTKEWIDDLTGKVPFYATRMDIHMALVNSEALIAAGIDSNTTDPIGGSIQRDNKGNPTGILKDSAMDLVKKIFKQDSKNSKETDFEKAVQYLHRNGITSVHDISNIGDYSFYESLAEKGKLNLRINSIPSIQKMEIHSELFVESKYPELFRCKTVKAFSDGSLGSSTAWFFEEYLNELGNFGLPTEIFQTGYIKELVQFADEKGIQLAIHAIGNRANSEVISLCESLNQKFGIRDRRFRIEHLQHIRRSDIERVRKEKIIASVQPLHLVTDADQIDSRLSPDVINESYSLRTLLDSQIKLAFGSDWTVVEPSVIKGIDAAVNRNTRAGKKHWLASQCISVKEAIDAYTISPAFASFEENIKGSITPGKLADFVILSENIFKIPLNEISSIEVISTYFNGELVYAKQ